jgi:hypothetical protein
MDQISSGCPFGIVFSSQFGSKRTPLETSNEPASTSPIGLKINSATSPPPLEGWQLLAALAIFTEPLLTSLAERVEPLHRQIPEDCDLEPRRSRTHTKQGQIRLQSQAAKGFRVENAGLDGKEFTKLFGTDLSQLNR